MGGADGWLKAAVRVWWRQAPWPWTFSDSPVTNEKNSIASFPHLLPSVLEQQQKGERLKYIHITAVWELLNKNLEPLDFSKPIRNSAFCIKQAPHFNVLLHVKAPRL